MEKHKSNPNPKPMTEEQNRMGLYQEKRSCKECSATYTIGEISESSRGFFDPPDQYSNGCYDYCLACWLGVGGPSLPLKARPGFAG